MKIQEEVQPEQLISLSGEQIPLVTSSEPELDVHEKSAVMFNALSKQFRRVGYELANRKKRAMVRVVEAFLFEPLEQVKLEGKVEQDLLDLMRQIMYHKLVINDYFETQMKDKETKENEQG